MPHIALPSDLPGITSAFAYRPETARPMRELAEVLLRGPNSLTPGERELIAASVSAGNECAFCRDSHRAAAANHLGGDYATVDAVIGGAADAPITDKLRALLVIAGKVRQDGRLVTGDDVAAARRAGASDREIHDSVLIAAAFSMFNRYVDGLAAWTPQGHDLYDGMGRRMAHEGYLRPGTDVAQAGR